MRIGISSLLLIVVKATLVYALDCDQCFPNAIYVGSKDDTSESACWTGGEKQPCSSLDLALEGARQLNSTVVIPAGIAEEIDHPSNSAAREAAKNCPPQWYFYNESTGCCECGEDLDGLVHCDREMDYTLVLSGYCMTSDNNMTVVGACLYNFFNISKATPYLSNYHILPLNVTLNDEMCGHFNREGNLCGKCKDNYSSPAYSYELHCIECTYTSYNWAKYIAVAFGPLTLFLFIIFLFKISATSPPLVAFVITCQIMTAPLIVRILLVSTEGNAVANTLVRIMTSVYGIWNLDFFRTLLPPICLQLTPLQTLLLDYAIAFYPLVLILIIYLVIELQVHNYRIVVWLLSPIRRCCIHFRRQWDVRKSTIDVFTSFTFLSFVKFLSVSSDILVPTLSHNVHGKDLDALYLYFNPATKYFGEEHLPYAILALLVLFVTVNLPILLFILYPCRCFQKCLARFQLRSYALHTFMDAFQGCLKDGTNGSRDCRRFAAVYLSTGYLMYFLYALVSNAYFLPLAAIVHIIVSILHNIRPYKLAYYNFIAAGMFLLMAVYCILALAIVTTSTHAPGYSTSAVVLFAILGTVPQLYITGVIIHWLVRKIILVLCNSRIRMPCGNIRRDFEETLPDRLVNPEAYERLLPNPLEDEYDEEELSDNTAY